MEELEYLPGSARDRFKDLRDREGLTQEQFAQIAGVQVSTISKIESGATMKISSTILIAIADHFHVTTDFLLGRVDIPDRSSYHIEQLGLSMEAAKNLYTGKLNPVIINALLENDRFCKLSYKIDRFFEDYMAKAVATQNQMLTSVSRLLRLNGIEDGAEEVASLRERQGSGAEIEKLSEDFGIVLREIKKSMGSQLDESKKMMAEAFEQMLSSVTANSDKPLTEVSGKDVLDAVVGMVSDNLTYMTQEQLSNLKKSMEPMFAPVPQKEAEDHDQ